LCSFNEQPWRQRNVVQVDGSTVFNNVVPDANIMRVMSHIWRNWKVSIWSSGNLFQVSVPAFARRKWVHPQTSQDFQ
jgi:hypothetical protein